MPTKKKAPNYTPEMTAEMIALYEGAGIDMTEAGHDARAAVVEALAEKFGKDVRSIRSKLVTEEVYIKRNETSSVTGEKPEKKEVIAERLAAAFGTSPEGKKLNATSLAKANKVDLQMLLNYFNAQVVEEAEMDIELAEDENESHVEEVAETTE